MYIAALTLHEYHALAAWMVMLASTRPPANSRKCHGIVPWMITLRRRRGTT